MLAGVRNLALDELAARCGGYVSARPGQGECPTGRVVRYHETLRFVAEDGWVRYAQRAVEQESGAVLHEEHGVLRPLPDGRLQLSLVMNSGRMELGVADFDGDTLTTDTTTFFNDHRGVKATRRIFAFRDGGVDKELWLATPAWPSLTRHMWGPLQRERG